MTPQIKVESPDGTIREMDTDQFALGELIGIIR